jgi:hypothetical protein
MSTRPLVVEHRITSKRFVGLQVRYWIEEDPAFGGVKTFEEAVLLVSAAERGVVSPGEKKGAALLAQLAAQLLAAIHAANSVEVCDKRGNGCAMHRDWP